MGKKLDREILLLEQMVRIYCKGRKHPSDGICSECMEILEYSMDRTRNCKFKDSKPICRNCKIHCYSEANRKKIREIMRYSGPRMLISHPIQVLLHILG